MSLIEHTCEDCGGSGSVRVHGAEDYGVSFECEDCETCHGSGVDVAALQADHRGAVEENERLKCDLASLTDYGQSIEQDRERLRGEVARLTASGGQ